MLRKDVHAGGVYAYHHQRTPHITWPYLVVSDRLYTWDNRANTLTLGRETSRMGAGDSWSQYRTGLVCVSMKVQDDRSDAFLEQAVKIIELADMQSAKIGDKLRDGDHELGTYVLVTSMAHFHGTYAEWNAARRRRNEQVAHVAEEYEAERAAREGRFTGIVMALAAYDIRPENMYDREDPRLVKLSMADVEKLLKHIEFGPILPE